MILFGGACSPVTDQIVKAARHWNLVQVRQILSHQRISDSDVKYLCWLICLIIYTLTVTSTQFLLKPAKFVLKMDEKWMEIWIISGDVRGHPSDVHSPELPSLLPSGPLREWIQWAASGASEAVQLDQSGNTLPEPGQILTGKTNLSVDVWWKLTPFDIWFT